MNPAAACRPSPEMDDRFTRYPALEIKPAGVEAGERLLRLEPSDPATAPTLLACANAVSDLAELGLPAVIEPFMVRRDNGRARNDLTADAVIRAAAIASGLGTTSAYTWLKIPVVAEMERVADAATLPALLRGGEAANRPDEMFAAWRHALTLPNIRGLVVGRNLLYPAGDDVAAAVDIAVSLL